MLGWGRAPAGDVLGAGEYGAAVQELALCDAKWILDSLTRRGMTRMLSASRISGLGGSRSEDGD
jgi:hypothetical protein